MAPWLRVLEAYLVQALLRTPAFHRGVEKVVRGVNRARHGVPPEEMGGTKLDQPGNSSFLKHFSEEIQGQLGKAEAKRIDQAATRGFGGHPEQNLTEAENADAVWETLKKQAPQKVVEGENLPSADAAWESARQRTEQGAKRGFLGEYIEALREQTKSGK